MRQLPIKGPRKIIIDILCYILMFALICGIYPRELQELAPTIFAGAQVLTFILTREILK